MNTRPRGALPSLKTSADSPRLVSQLTERHGPGIAGASPAQRLKAGPLQALQMVLPEAAEVADILRAWRAADDRYWAGQLRPCWLTAGIEPYGKCLGSWNPGTRTLNRVPTLWAITR